jgi:hypothetical protein
MGTVMDEASDFLKGRITKKNRKVKIFYLRIN